MKRLAGGRVVSSGSGVKSRLVRMCKIHLGWSSA